jgi:uncharacterized protein YndB with AHSA1/START domain
MSGQIATADVEISASPAQVWQALTEPEQIREYLFGAEVETTWAPGSPITWQGEVDGETFEDKGEVLECVPQERLAVTRFSPLSGKPDEPASYVQVRWTLHDEGPRTKVTLEQDGNSDEQAVAEARENWTNVLRQLKEHVERG